VLLLSTSPAPAPVNFVPGSTASSIASTRMPVPSVRVGKSAAPRSGSAVNDADDFSIPARSVAIAADGAAVAASALLIAISFVVRSVAPCRAVRSSTRESCPVRSAGSTSNVTT